MEVADAGGLVPLLDVLGWGSPQDEVEGRLQRIADHPDYTGWVAVEAGRVVGFATGQLNWMVQVHEPVAELVGLAVLPEGEGSGAGSRLLAAFEAWVVDAGAQRLKVTSGGHRPLAHGFYERRGYRRTGVRFHKTIGSA
jgi:GNAT superfamily N-acetyltransferase